MFKLDNKSALVTGASAGIGKAIAKSLHSQGANVILHGTSEERLKSLKAELSGNTQYIVADLSSREGVLNLHKEAIEKFENIDILVNNAGINRDNLLLRMKDQDWDSVINVNLTSIMVLCREVIRKMLKQRWGRIISISSIVGITGNLGQANYSASKSGIIGFSKSLAYEVASRGITVNVVAPGFIETKMTGELTEDLKNKMLQNIPLTRFGKPSEIASAVSFLASEEAAYITGSTININGGMAMI